MQSRIEEAKQRHIEGYNCAQAVFCTYCDSFGLSEEEGYRLSEGLGSGMGGLQATCGSASAMFLLASMANSDAILASKATRPQTYELIRQMAAKFQNENNFLNCKEILQDVDKSGMRMHSCRDCVASGARIIEVTLAQYFDEKNKVIPGKIELKV